MARDLVLTSENAGHPFRRSLPPRVLRPLPQPEPEVLAAILRSQTAAVEVTVPERRAVQWPRLTMQDGKDFLLAYCACFMAVSAFIS